MDVSTTCIQLQAFRIENFLYFSILSNVPIHFFLIILAINTTKMTQKHAQKALKIVKARCFGVGYGKLPLIFLRNGLCVRKARMPEKRY